ncbi:MAG: discoidin domain-containing protein, partial [Betaproteobacteria bacterium]
FSFSLRGDAAPNTLQFKLLDASGENVWWVNRPDFDFPRDWQRIRLKRRHLSFAWGPAQGRRLKRSAAVELVIVRGRGGGKGTVCFDNFTFRELPARGATPVRPLVHATSDAQSTQAQHLADGAMDTVWRSIAGKSKSQTVTLDFRGPQEFGGLVLHWAAGAHASRYVIESSDDGKRWRTLRRVTSGNGGVDPHYLPESEARFVRLRMQDGPGSSYGLAEIEIKDVAWSASPNQFFEHVARYAPRGHYPRAYAGEQSYWTLLGIDGGARHGLLSEDGALEPGPQSPSIEPFLLADGRLITWADVAVEQALQEHYLPIPTVRWRAADVALHVTAFGAGDPGRAQILAHYTVENRSARRKMVTLVLAVRPFQVNPPPQFLNIAGGVAPVRELEWDGKAIRLNGTPAAYPLHRPDGVLTASFDAGSVAELLSQGRLSGETSVRDETGFATGLLLYRMELPAYGSRRIALVAPLEGEPIFPSSDAAAWVDRQQAATAAHWREKLNRTTLKLPDAGAPMWNTVRTALAHVLIGRAGPALQPGTRAYARSWIRDGVMMSDALSRLGHSSVARAYIEWFARHQFRNGKVPCCVDHRGADPVAENDSHGALIYAIAQHFRHRRDRAWLERMWPRVEAAMTYMNALRISERTTRNQQPERRAFYGIMPPSISHEGYSDKPAYSYWDDFWTLAGYDAAVEVADALGRNAEFVRYRTERDEFRRDLAASVRESIARHRISFIPGAADRGDYDPTSTTIALSLTDMQNELPQAVLRATFERYWKEFAARRGSDKWEAYTPYEWRNIGAFIRLGWRQRLDELVAFFLADRRPSAWNQWAEVVGRDARQPRFIGDMPHGWVASDYISAVLDMFAYERKSDHSLVLAAGVAPEWLDAGIAVAELHTAHGMLSYRVKRVGDRLELRIDSGVVPPRGGFVIPWPYRGKPGRTLLNGQPVQWETDRELRVSAAPASITIELPPARN